MTHKYETIHQKNLCVHEGTRRRCYFSFSFSFFLFFCFFSGRTDDLSILTSSSLICYLNSSFPYFSRNLDRQGTSKTDNENNTSEWPDEPSSDQPKRTISCKLSHEPTSLSSASKHRMSRVPYHSALRRFSKSSNIPSIVERSYILYPFRYP